MTRNNTRPPRSAGRRSSSSMDMGRLAEAVSRPGIDPRLWTSLAHVDAIAFDAEEGVLVDITLRPSGIEETARLGAMYAGNGFGLYAPIAVDDEVLVAIPMGDTANGLVIVQRMHSPADPPFPEQRAGAGGDVASDDVVLRVQSGKRLRVFTAGGGTLEMTVEGGGAMVLKTGTGRIEMQNASQSYVRGESYADALDLFLTSLEAFTAGLIAAPPAPPNGALTVAVVIPLATALQTASQTLRGQRPTYLSTRIRGE